jgi:MFS family permease
MTHSYEHTELSPPTIMDSSICVDVMKSDGSAANDTSQPNIRNLIAACSAITVFGLAFGMTYPLLSLILEDRGVSANMIGINSAMMPIGILLFSSVIPMASKRFGSRQVAMVAAVVTAILILAYKAFDTLGAWFIIRLLQGMSISTLFVLSEAWIVEFAGNEHRGKIVAIYASVLSASFGAGPAIVSWTGIHGWTPFAIGAGVIAIGVLPLSLVREKPNQESEESASSRFFQFVPKAPMLLMAVLAFAIFDAATLSLIPVYGVQTGLSVSIAALALSVLIAGNIFFQVPLGWLADRIPHRIMIGSCALATVLMLLLLPYVMNTIWMWPVLVIIGSTGFGVYTVSLTSLGDRFKGQELVNGSAALAVAWGFGALLGSVSGGWAMNSFGPHGLPMFCAVVYLLLVVGLVVPDAYTRLRQDSVTSGQIAPSGGI